MQRVHPDLPDRRLASPAGSDARPPAALPAWPAGGICVLLAVAAGLGLAGCGPAGGEQNAGSASAPHVPLAPPTPPGRTSIPELRDALGIEQNVSPDQRGHFRRTGDEITQIELYQTGVIDLSPLEGLPLTILGISECPVEDLSPLAGMPLEKLSAQDTRVTDLSPLAETKLTELYLLGSPVAEIAPLADLPLTKLNLVGTQVTDLAPIEKMPLQTLWIGSTEVADLAALTGKNLVSLDIEDTSIDDLGPLSGMSRLRRLNIAGTSVTDLTPLAGLRLERLIFDPERIETGLDIVREMPSLRELGPSLEGVMPAEQFWAQQGGGG